MTAASMSGDIFIAFSDIAESFKEERPSAEVIGITNITDLTQMEASLAPFFK